MAALAKNTVRYRRSPPGIEHGLARQFAGLPPRRGYKGSKRRVVSVGIELCFSPALPFKAERICIGGAGNKTRNSLFNGEIFSARSAPQRSFLDRTPVDLGGT